MHFHMFPKEKSIESPDFSAVSSNKIAPKEEIQYSLSALGAISNADIPLFKSANGANSYGK